MKLRLPYRLLVFTILTIALAACGGAAEEAAPTATVETQDNTPIATSPPTEMTAPTDTLEAQDDGDDTDPGGGETITIILSGGDFNPGDLTVAVGTTVIWVNEDSVPHTVTADDGLFESGILQGGDTFEFTFTEAGTILYYCRFHGGPGGSGMSATITVTP